MITLTSIELVNVRALAHVTFTPEPNGLTVLTGDNGAGKSSVFTGALWALFGTTPEGVPVTGMRRQGSEGQECRVTVTLRHDHQTVEVSRGLKGARDATWATVSVDNIQQAVSASEVPRWVSARLGLDMAGFLAAFMVRQKELDQLITDRPADRRRLIERLAGIERLARAVETARGDARTAETVLARATGDSETLACAQQAATVAEHDHEAAVTALTAAEQAATAASAAHTDAEAAHAQAAQDALTATRAETALTAARTAAAAADATAAAATDENDRAQAALETISTAPSLEHAQAEHTRATEHHTAARDAETAARDADNALTTARTSTSHARSNVEAARRRLDQVSGEHSDQVTAEQVTAATDTVTALTNQAQSVQQALGATRATYTHLQAELAAEVGHDCPTCGSQITDVGAYIARLREQLTQVTRDGKDLAAQEQALSNELVTARRAATELAVKAEHTARAHAWVSTARADLAAAQQTLTQAQNIEQAAEHAAREAREAATRFDLAAAQTALEHSSATVHRAQQADTLRGHAHAATVRAEAATAAAAAAHQRLEDAEAAVEATAPLLVAARQTQQNVAEAAATLRDAQAQVTRAQAAVTITEAAATAAKTALTHQQQLATERAQAQEALERAKAVVESLAQFRADRLSQLAPELSERATTFVTSMTDGRYIRVELNEEFTPMVTDDAGYTRPASYLSGGELDAVAMALRVAIGDLVTGGSGGLLVLDEVFSAQDARRRAAMVGLLRDSGRQVLVINHAAESTDQADQIVQIVPGPTGSTARTIDGADVDAGEDLTALGHPDTPLPHSPVTSLPDGDPSAASTAASTDPRPALAS